MRISLIGVSFATTLVTACSSSNAMTGLNPHAPTELTARSLGTSDSTVLHRKRVKQRLYVSDAQLSVIYIFALPSFESLGEITSGISNPEGIATDKNGNLYVSNWGNDSVTVYKPGKTRPYLTLTGAPYSPADVAVADNGYVFAGDVGGGVDVYPPGATSPRTRLVNPAIARVGGVGVDASNNVYAGGLAPSERSGVVVEYSNMSGSGVNLRLNGLLSPTGVFIDNLGNIVVTDDANWLIDIYPPGQTTPSSTIAISNPGTPGINKAENTLYVPQLGPSLSILSYPGGSQIGSIGFGSGSYVWGAALSPPAKP